MATPNTSDASAWPKYGTAKSWIAMTPGAIWNSCSPMRPWMEPDRYCWMTMQSATSSRERPRVRPKYDASKRTRLTTSPSRLKATIDASKFSPGNDGTASYTGLVVSRHASRM